MKAVICERYGAPHTLRIKNINKPQPSENNVLVKVRATAINDWDWSLVRGKPYIYRLIFGLFRPRNSVFGVELAGIVEAVGTGVTKFKPGDRVYGDISMAGMGGWAEFVVVSEEALMPIPGNMDFFQATSLPHAFMLASQSLIDIGQLRSGQKILINGAGGGVGAFGLQIAKTFDAEVTGVDRGIKLNSMKDQGFDHVINYQKEDFTRNRKKYDLILDAKTSRSPFTYLRSLNKDGTYVTVGGSLFYLFQLMLLSGIFRSLMKKNMKLLALKPNKDGDYIQSLYLQGLLKPLIDGPYPFEDIPQRLQYFGEGKHLGKIVIEI